MYYSGQKMISYKAWCTKYMGHQTLILRLTEMKYWSGVYEWIDKDVLMAISQVIPSGGAF